MALRYKFEVLAALKEKGYSSYRLGNEKLLSSSSIQKLRRGIVLGTDGIDRLCKLLHCQPGDILEYVEEEE